jgi:hypothetical protein
MKPQPDKPTFALEFRVTIQGISPLVWRQIRISSSSSLAELHNILQIVFAWQDQPSYQFLVHGFSIAETQDAKTLDARAVKLMDLELRVGEKLVYSCQFKTPWTLELRLINCMVHNDDSSLPILMAGERSAPIENILNPREFLFKRREQQLNPPLKSLQLAAQSITFVLDHNTRPDSCVMEDLEVAANEINTYLQFTSKHLDVDALNLKLRPATVAL